MGAGIGRGAGVGLMVAGLGLMFVLGVAGAQQTQKNCMIVDEDGKTVVWPNCKPPADDKTPPASDGSRPTGGAPAVPAVPTDKNDLPASKRFPFPGEQPAGDAPQPAVGGDTKAAPPNAGGLQDAGSSGTSSSAASPDSSSSSSSSAGASGDANPEDAAAGPLGEDDDTAAKAAAARKSARRKLPPVARQSPDEREQEDLKVASFYMDDKNYKGAYARATDAVAIAADDAEAHFALAEAARRLGKLDEAEAHYKKCLTLDPEPKMKKSAEKALKEMSGGG
jgi:hypothetical protein